MQSYRNQSQSQSQSSEILPSQNIGQKQQQYKEQNSQSLEVKQLNIPYLGRINKKQPQLCGKRKQKSQFRKNVFQLQNEFYLFSSEKRNFSNRTSRFPYLIWGKHQLLKNIANFSIFFTQILQTSKRRTVQIELDLTPKLPEKVKGATICLTDESKNGQKNLYQTTFCLVQKMRQIQQTSTSWTGMQSVSILLPRMLVPVVMGKQGRILGKIKSLSECDIVVHGPYYGGNYNYQDIQINSPMIENISKSIYLIYLVAYKALRSQPIKIPLPNPNTPSPLPFSFYLPGSSCMRMRPLELEQPQCSLQLLLPNTSYRSAIEQYEKYIDGVMEYYGVETKVGKYGVYSRSCQHQPYLKHVVYCMNGQLEAVQLFVNSILRVLWFQNCLDDSLTILINQSQARSITSLSGKILRDMSSKSHNCFIQLREKDKQQNRIIIKGDIEAKIKAACLICQFICFENYILEQQKNNQPIQYICELVQAAEVLERQLYWSQNQGQRQGEHQGQRYKRIKKQKKDRKVKKSNKHSSYRQRYKQKQKWNKRASNKNINSLSQQQINYRVAYLLTEHMNSPDN